MVVVFIWIFCSGRKTVNARKLARNPFISYLLTSKQRTGSKATKINIKKKLGDIFRLSKSKTKKAPRKQAKAVRYLRDPNEATPKIPKNSTTTQSAQCNELIGTETQRRFLHSLDLVIHPALRPHLPNLIPLSTTDFGNFFCF